MSINVGLLTIGNEVVDGQIVNGNAAWLSQALLELGFEMNRHLSVKDGLAEITEGLEYLSATCQLIITTGGLGPTVDDRTRQAIAQFLEADLEFRNDQWEIIQKKIESRNVPVRPEHKQQAYAPKGSLMLANSRGVAPGFFFKGSAIALAALPGPPNELQGIWKEHLREQLQQQLHPKKEQALKTWICFGAAESEVQHKVKDLFTTVPLEYGFRLHKPFVELKCWYKAFEGEKWKSFFNKVTTILGPWYVGNTIADFRRPFTDQLKSGKSLQIFDGLTQGLFLDRLKEAGVNTAQVDYAINRSADIAIDTEKAKKALSLGTADYKLAVIAKDEHTAVLIHGSRDEDLTTYRNIPITSSLGKLVIIEKVFARGLSLT